MGERAGEGRGSGEEGRRGNTGDGESQKVRSGMVYDEAKKVLRRAR